MATQYERELLVASFLDITVGQWTEAIRDKIEELEASDLGQFVAQAYGDLTDPESDGRLYVQTIAQLSDDSLHTLVRIAGTDPLPEAA